ncbi:MAG: twin-arginine translocase TatA/TatE family subunit [Cryomorphaceae bacterium]|jgi:sec-independent protein translocase protein TatA|nr:twin-arginine translocase TatA/TatE family subunit [Cryomorphaceae bacterium]
MVLFFNDVSGTEVLVILIFILMFFGSKSIPGIARTFGRTIRQIKDASNELQDEIRKSGVDIKKDLNLTRIVEETAQDISQPLDQVANELDDTVLYEPKKNVPEDTEVNIVENILPKKDESVEEQVEVNNAKEDKKDPQSPSE